MRNGTQFNVGPFRYTAKIVKGWLTHDGRQCSALCLFRRQELLVSDQLSPDQRLHALLHELRHAYQYHFPTAKLDEEGECDFFGNMVLQLLKDLFGGAAINATLPAFAKAKHPIDVSDDVSHPAAARKAGRAKKP